MGTKSDGIVGLSAMSTFFSNDLSKSYRLVDSGHDDESEGHAIDAAAVDVSPNLQFDEVSNDGDDGIFLLDEEREAIPKEEAIDDKRPNLFGLQLFDLFPGAPMYSAKTWAPDEEWASPVGIVEFIDAP
eukprot:CAMPEP_0176085998 /NCGR_PEP_ID=MMETSP0120_2-20121206/43046_1 /TAXON_ID=160619 /ORGANISM="Kryptoperidinium foliaceum, Strain CCMP 1326" /LENGTH=128 /DNA_ID=CAMNT_0017419825 /DNA_START=192 /DNA_END=574 /DNA_ORIENTATION=-